MKDLMKHSFSKQHQMYSSHIQRQGSQRLLKDILVSWDEYQLAFATLSNLQDSQLIISVGLYKFACKLDILSSLLVQRIWIALFKMASSHNQAIADVGLENHPPMLEKGSYVPWLSRFMRFIDGNKGCDGDPPVLPFKRIQEETNLKGDDKNRFKVDIDAMNAILLGISNDIYNYVDACKMA
ncbi:hypothetical protein Tco_0717326 [Tanacetum coccineum]